MASLNISSSPITQVSQTVSTHASLQPQLLTRLLLDLRGKRFSVDRETIMNLPESVLLCLFPNGLVLSRQSVALSDGGDNEEEEELYHVDVSNLRWVRLSCEKILTRLVAVRPRVFCIRTFVFPECVGCILWHDDFSRAFFRSATSPRRIVRLESRTAAKPFAHEAGYHRSARRT
jgi:hypothetical protein